LVRNNTTFYFFYSGALPAIALVFETNLLLRATSLAIVATAIYQFIAAPSYLPQPLAQGILLSLLKIVK